MGFIVRLLSYVSPWLKVDLGSGDVRTGRLASPAGHFAIPLAGDVPVAMALPGKRVVIVGFIDTAPPALEAGEQVSYSRDGSGAVIASAKLSRLGVVTITNGNGTIEMAADGEITMNGVTISPDGKLTAAEAEFTDSLKVGPTSAEVIGHTHISASSGSPTGPFPV